MHIPDGYLGPPTWIATWVTCIVLWNISARKVRNDFDSRRIPLIAIASAFSFLIMMFNIPIPGGTTGHAVGGVLIALAVGPWAASLAVSITVVVQSLLFGDGGITAIGANCLTMAFIMPFSGYCLYKILCYICPDKNFWKAIAAGISGWFGLNVAAMLAAILLGIQPLLHSVSGGYALYSPYSISITVPIMCGEHALIFGVIEGLITGFAVYALLNSKSSWVLENWKITQ